MPETPRYPGVYVEEQPPNLRAVPGAETSVAAFVGRFARGPVGRPVPLIGPADVERQFGGLWASGEASYALRQFFANGGSRALAVRVAPGATAARAILRDSEGAAVLHVTAGRRFGEDSLADPGTWGNALRLEIAPAKGGVENAFDLSVAELTLEDGQETRIRNEVYYGLSLDPAAASYAPAAVNAVSESIQLELDPGGAPNLPAAGSFALSGGTDGEAATAGDLIGSASEKSGLHALDEAETFSLLCLPEAALLDRDGETAELAKVSQAAAALCQARRAILLIDPPAGVTSAAEAAAFLDALAAAGLCHRNAAAYFPSLEMADPLDGGRPRCVGPGGSIAGLIARVDSTRGVWKAPAGAEAGLDGVVAPTTLLGGAEIAALSARGLNAIRRVEGGRTVCWGARTLASGNPRETKWKYLAVRRLALYIEESLDRGLRWAVFEPNAEPLWAALRHSVEAFLNQLFRQGAFHGATAQEAYFVKCGAETTAAADRDAGLVRILVGFASLRPAEFHVLQFALRAGTDDG